MNSFQQSQEQRYPPDPTAPIAPFLDAILKTLDTPSTLPIPQLHSQPRIIVHGNPISPTDFQNLWRNLPLTQHQLTSYDAHLLPGPNGSVSQGHFVIMAHLKVRFDESGKNRSGDSGDIMGNNNVNTTNISSHRANWSHWFGVVLNCIVDASVVEGWERQCISSWDYRFTERPDSSVYGI
ncbi:Mtr2 protein [Martiniozyma asiatica (nom. inval.)]|nr:Mtr2 protein [Martiniozyma asiatica]